MHKVLIANRGEVALRVKKTLDKMGIPAVMVYSVADRLSRHVTEADEAYCIGDGPSAQSYLLQDRIIETARKSGCDAIHPGYGFLAENADFADKVVQAGLIFIGPRGDVMRMFGSKIEARQAMVERGVPVAPGTNEPVEDLDAVKQASEKTGFPLLIKAAGGGGGKGMRIVRNSEDLASSYEQCVREAKNAFGDPRVFVEKYLENAHHIEFQIIGDKYGNAFHFGHRECSVQRRHQKLIEETPSMNVSPEEEARLSHILCGVVRDIGYDSLGTFEFMKDGEGNYAFLEMNTRLQVEHSVTEMTWNVDLVELQVKVAYGERLEFRQEELVQSGHAMECRICAEDCLNNFAPSPGLVRHFSFPEARNLRLDWFAPTGCEIALFYDPMIAKLSVVAQNRIATIMEMSKALGKIRIQGFPTNIPFHRLLLKHPVFQKGEVTTAWVSENSEELVKAQKEHLRRLENLVAAFLAAEDSRWGRVHESYPLYLECAEGIRELRIRREIRSSVITVTVSDDCGEDVFDCTWDAHGNYHALCQNRSLRGRKLDLAGVWEIESQRVLAVLHAPGSLPLKHVRGKNQTLSGRVESPINGKILKLGAKSGDWVEEGQLLMILEAMKMENEIRAPISGVIEEMPSGLEGMTVGKGDFLLEIRE